MIDAVVVWIDQAPPAQPPPVLAAWASSRGLRLVAPGEGGRKPIAVDPAIATRVEDELHVARELLTQHDADGTERALARAEGLLRDHPEMPQGAWLMAEVERGWATRYARLEPVDAARAARAWRAAAAIDGGRAAGVGEPTADPDSAVVFSLELDQGQAELRLDGLPIEPGTLQTRPGLHQLVAKADGVVVFASWLTIVQATVVRIALPTPTLCSRADLARAGVETAGVRCPAWVAVRPGDTPGGFRVRTCDGAACGPEVSLAPLQAHHDHSAGPEHRGLPKWLTWTLVGAGVLAVGVATAYTAWWLATPYGQVTTWHQGTTDTK